MPDDVEWLEYAREDEGAFDQNGHWKSDLTAPKEWPSDPSSLLEQKEFWEVLNQALSELPPRTARAFVLREVDGFRTEEICEILGITSGHLTVSLERARKRLRRRLESHMFEFGRESVTPLIAEAPVA